MNREDQRNISTLLSQVYSPSVPERKLKARFWTAWTDGPSKGDPTTEDAIRLVGKAEKFADPAFADWFLNKKEMLETLHFLQSLTMDMLTEGLLDPDLKFSEKMKAAAMVWDMVKATAPKQEVQYADKLLAEKTDEELEAEIKRLQG
jgi:hypothetical protein